MATAELFRIFGVEAARHLARCRELLLGPAPPTPDGLTELFRGLHSVKGMAVSLGLDELARRTHETEEIVEERRRSKEAADDAFRGDLLRRISALLALQKAALDDRAAAATSHDRDAMEDEPLFSLLENDLRQVPVPPDRLDRLLEVTLALATAHQRLEHLLGPPENRLELFRLRNELDRSVRMLRQEVLEMRLLPVREIVPLFEPTLVRWSEQRGVRVAFAVRGGTVVVDRAILERLLDPLGHVLRNAIVHGVEPPAERRGLGKPARATIDLVVRREGERLSIDVRDDGRGVDLQEVVDRARERGVLPEGAEPPRGDDALSLLAAPGMSSRDSVDHLSGRGVGLSAVRATVERLGGSLELSGKLGHGFAVRLTVPTRLALISAFVVEAGGQSFAVPVDVVREVRASSGGSGDVHLASCLGMPAGASHSRAPRRAALHLDAGGMNGTLLVDGISGPRELVVRPLGPPLDRAEMPWAGAALLPEGGLALVLDPARLRSSPHV